MNQLERDNLIAAETGCRSYRHLPQLTDAEQAERDREEELERLKRRLALAERETRGRIDAKHRYRETR